MKRHNSSAAFKQFTEHRALLAALSDDLALPLLQIKTSLELVQNQALLPQAVKAQTSAMTLSADSGLQLIEAYRLALQVNQNMHLAMEPVAVGAVLQDVAHALTPYAKQ